MAYDLRKGDMIPHSRPIDLYIINVVSKGESSDSACIRANSSIFVGTAYAYLFFIFNMSIEGFNVKDIVGIE
jgi:hypothetical protein